MLLSEPRRDSRRELGRWGERLAEQVLVEAGLRILERRFRCRAGEIDLIAESGRTWVFVEVKTRRAKRYGAPAEAVTRDKQRHIARVAAYYLNSRGGWDRPCRFDVVEVRVASDGTSRVRHLKHAFDLPFG